MCVCAAPPHCQSWSSTGCPKIAKASAIEISFFCGAVVFCQTHYQKICLCLGPCWSWFDNCQIFFGKIYIDNFNVITSLTILCIYIYLIYIYILRFIQTTGDDHSLGIPLTRSLHKCVGRLSVPWPRRKSSSWMTISGFKWIPETMSFDMFRY